MPGILFTAASFLCAFYMIERFLPQLSEQRHISYRFVIIPASYLTGTLFSTVASYLVCLVFARTGDPLFFGVSITSLILLSLSAVLIFRDRGKKILEILLKPCIRKTDMIMVFLFLAAASFLMILTYRVIDNSLFMGMQVYSDASLHTALIRSFSKGANIPAVYPVFPDSGINYHFLFQFHAGILEYLGMRIDWAFNLPAILSMWSFLMLFYALAVHISGKRLAGILACVFFFLRSSFAIFVHVLSSDNPADALFNLAGSTEYIGKTPFESWGIWNLNVFVNQRHFAFSLGLLMLSLLLFAPLMKKTGDAWKCRSFARPIFIGLVMGMSAYLNGAVLIAAVSIFFVMGIFSKHRLEYVLAALIIFSVSYMESFILGGGGMPVTPALSLGFVSPSQHIADIALYYLELFGLLPILAVVSLFMVSAAQRRLLAAFCAPFVLANLVRLTPDITVNHKYINVSAILTGIFAAIVVCRMLLNEKRTLRICGMLLILVLTATGVSDIVTLYNKTDYVASIKPYLDDPVALWIEKNTEKRAVFASYPHDYTHPVLMAGRRLFMGMVYFSSSAGYDTDSRVHILDSIYSADDIDVLRDTACRHGIDYIIVEECNRTEKNYQISEKTERLFDEKLARVYENGQGRLKIFRVD